MRLRYWALINVAIPTLWALTQLVRAIEPTRKGLMVSVASRPAGLGQVRRDARVHLRRLEGFAR